MALVVKILLCVVAVAAALWAAALLVHPMASTPTTEIIELHTITLNLGATTIAAEVADTPALRERGLGGRTSLAEGSGMWFVFDTDDYWPFWMKDTLIPLDMLWVAADGTIVTIARDVRPESYPQAYEPTQPARYVLEVPAGFAASRGIAEGQIIHILQNKI